MNRDKLKYDIEKRLHSAQGQVSPFLSHLSGYVFLGRKWHKDGSYTSTCWLTFCYFPVAPLETYRITFDGGRHMLPKIFAVDELIPYDRTKEDFSYAQVISTGLAVWVPAFSILFFLFVYPLATFLGVLVGVSVFSIYQVTKKSEPQAPSHNSIAELKARLEQPQPVLEKKQEPASPVTPVVAPVPPVKVEAKPEETKTEHLMPASIRTGQGFAPVVPMTHEAVITQEPRGYGLVFLGLLNLVLILAYVFYYGYFSLNHVVGSYMVYVYKLFVIFSRAHLLSIVSFNIGLFIMLFRSKFIGLLLMIFAAALFFGLDIKLWNYLFDCCFVR